MKILLNEGWKLAYIDAASQNDEAIPMGDTHKVDWMDAEVPGDVHSTLLKHGRIEDPFYSTNVEKCKWVEDKVWWYRKEFNFKSPAGMKNIILKFNGLDTFATVYLNGEPLGKHENMFTPAEFDVTNVIKPGTNSIAVKFDSITTATKDKDYNRMWYSYNTNRAWVRKAQMNFRWDWGPKLLTTGI